MSASPCALAAASNLDGLRPREKLWQRGAHGTRGKKAFHGQDFSYLLPRSIAGFLPPGILSPPTNPSTDPLHTMSTTVKIEILRRDIFPSCPYDSGAPTAFEENPGQTFAHARRLFSAPTWSSRGDPKGLERSGLESMESLCTGESTQFLAERDTSLVLINFKSHALQETIFPERALEGGPRG